MLTLLAIPVALAVGALATMLLVRLFPAKFNRPNFQQRTIPNACGLIFVIGGALYYATLAATRREPSWTMFLIAITGFGLLGLLDDLFGDRSVGGLKGHLSALTHGRVTTGAVKAIGGGTLAFVCGWLIERDVARALLAAFLIAGAANSLNLVDLRPGRCLSLFFAASILIVAAGIATVLHGDVHPALPFMFPLIAAMALFPWERRARFMLGDTGANSFGAALGLGYVFYFPSPWAQGVAALLILALHVWTEGHSISKWIESTPVLRRLDSKIGVR